ncbi:hypothetical protein I4F81_010818 [Pyropia yezoensis]|uniref:Uncharacterized protein n=1 Tax=Pyropia yezoensis TaxID=2788 RepID=A0ACC3CEF9_PYRYE|nr:hypothetical protein I4F81_010818 [Neopyropia yezoensis]
MAFAAAPAGLPRAATRSATATTPPTCTRSAVSARRSAFTPAAGHRAAAPAAPAAAAAAGVSVARPPPPPRMAASQPYTSIITGASSSIGMYAAKALIARGDTHVVMAVRDPAKAARVAAEFGFADGTYSILPVDLSSLDSVRSFVTAFRAGGFRGLTSLVCNAAVWYPRDKAPRLTGDGFDETLQVNHLGHFLMVNLLMGELKRSCGRVVFLATPTHNPDTIAGKVPPQASLGDLAGLEAAVAGTPSGTVDGGKFEPTKAYKDSKVCNVLTMTALHERAAKDGVVVSAVFPGCIADSELFREKRGWFRWFFPLFQKYVTKQYVSEEEAGRRVAEVAGGAGFGDGGGYWMWKGSYLEGADKTAPTRVPSTEREGAKADRLWELSAKAVGL